MHECGHTYLQASLLLLLAERAGHGYDLTARLAPFGLTDADTTGTYRALRGLERAGLVESHWTPSPGGPARRVYYLTQRGREALLSCGHDLVRDQRQIAEYLRRLRAVLSVSRELAATLHEQRSTAEARQ